MFECKFVCTTLYIQVDTRLLYNLNCNGMFFIYMSYVVGVAYACLVTVFLPDDGPYRAEPYRRQ